MARAIAALHGFVLGGGLELAEACHLRIAAADARFGHPEIELAGVAGWGGTTRLPRLIDRGRALELLLTGRQLTASEALAWGLVNQVVPREQLVPTVHQWAASLTAKAASALALTLEAVRQGLEAGEGAALLLGAKASALAAATDDFRRATTAFTRHQGSDG